MTPFWKTIGKKPKNSKTKPPKKDGIDVFASFSAFLVSLKRIQISNMFSTRSTFSASFSKSLIFPIEVTLMLFFLKNQNTNVGPSNWGRRQIFLPINRWPHTHIIEEAITKKPKERQRKNKP